ncbi:MAG: TetR/AcrR family transcriptional regulator [Anaerolineae bacterium]
MNNTSISTRERILAAAVQVILEKGTERLTLDATAQTAGVSKGGLLYHFASKDALIEGLLHWLLDGFNQQLKAELEREPEAPGRWLRAYIRATFADPDSPPKELVTMLLGGLASESALAKIVRDAFASWRDYSLQDGLPPARATLIRHAVDAFWMEGILHLPPSSLEDPAALEAELIRLTYLEGTATL